jgi:hypothetical protein
LDDEPVNKYMRPTVRRPGPELGTYRKKMLLPFPIRGRHASCSSSWLPNANLLGVPLNRLLSTDKLFWAHGALFISAFYYSLSRKSSSSHGRYDHMYDPIYYGNLDCNIAKKSRLSWIEAFHLKGASISKIGCLQTGYCPPMLKKCMFRV